MTIAMEVVPEFASAAARKAIAEWGHPATDITLNSGPAPVVQRTMLNLHGCFGGSSTLRVAKDLTEYNLRAGSHGLQRGLHAASLRSS
ncbi:hypothetical protein PR202_ga22286 [Eleusine coracana subsp. coracana]|uniref:Chalcone/stilbene synthase N-terminal domain-containing protein n=1 Tax=Eleusine coracana subsp. coracana TaxID=191504 RepID=A0AAV5D359_ELECO|nr:hypothetical protein PR202_ga22286 [Eleusine coracana subsp. coracana]